MAALISSLLAKRVRGATGTICLCGTVEEPKVRPGGGNENGSNGDMWVNVSTWWEGCGFGDGVLSLRNGFQYQVPVGLLSRRQSRSETVKSRVVMKPCWMHNGNTKTLLSIAVSNTWRLWGQIENIYTTTIMNILVSTFNTDLRSGLEGSDTLLDRPLPPHSVSSSSASSLSSSALRFTRTTELATGALRFRDNSSCRTEYQN